MVRGRTSHHSPDTPAAPAQNKRAGESVVIAVAYGCGLRRRVIAIALLGSFAACDSKRDVRTHAPAPPSVAAAMAIPADTRTAAPIAAQIVLDASPDGRHALVEIDDEQGGPLELREIDLATMQAVAVAPLRELAALPGLFAPKATFTAAVHDNKALADELRGAAELVARYPAASGPVLANADRTVIAAKSTMHWIVLHDGAFAIPTDTGEVWLPPTGDAVYVMEYPRTEVDSYDVASGTTTVRVPPTRFLNSPDSWRLTRDGLRIRIVWISETELCAFELELASTASNRRRCLGRSPGPLWRVSDDGHWLAFERGSRGSYEIMDELGVIDLETGRLASDATGLDLGGANADDWLTVAPTGRVFAIHGAKAYRLDLGGRPVELAHGGGRSCAAAGDQLVCALGDRLIVEQ
jgi:hypothetical protein